MLDPKSWLPKAQDLQPGRRKRVDHDCGSGRTLLLSRDQDGLKAYCFRCNEHGRHRVEESLADKAARLERLRVGDAHLHRGVAHGAVNLPLPAVHGVPEWPEKVRLWLYKAGLGAPEIARLGAYYHPPSDRVVLPVLDASGRPVFWQARALDGRQPKYMAPAVDKSAVFPRWGSADTPTLCEDILSAFKVGLVAEGWAILGTRIPAVMLSELLRRGSGCSVWLDPDPAGQRGAHKIIKQLSAFGIPCRNIVSDKDPKLLFRSEIKEHLCPST